MQFRVPQNIAMEDRIVGSLTAIQFGILVIGGFITFFVYSSSLPSIFRTGGALVFGFLTIILALGKFNDQPMYRFFRFIIAFLTRPKTRVWRKGGKEIQLIRPVTHTAEEDAQKVAVKRHSKAEIAHLAAMVDSRGKSNTPLTPPR